MYATAIGVPTAQAIDTNNQRYLRQSCPDELQPGATKTKCSPKPSKKRQKFHRLSLFVSIIFSPIISPLHHHFTFLRPTAGSFEESGLSCLPSIPWPLVRNTHNACKSKTLMPRQLGQGVGLHACCKTFSPRDLLLTSPTPTLDPG